MRFGLLTALSALAASVVADVEFTSPAAGASLVAGSAIAIKWEDSGVAPALSALSIYSIFLCAGGNTAGSFIQLTTLGTPGAAFTAGSSATGTLNAGLGASVENAYFLKVISTIAEGGTVINYSSRFSITGMTGTFPATVTTGLESVSGTDGPATDNDDTTAATTAAAAAGGDFTLAYQLQTGLTKYAPMQPVPHTKITATSPTPLHPTSAYTIATTYLSAATILTTITESQTYSVSSIENTVAAASAPTGDAKKFLNRWKD